MKAKEYQAIVIGTGSAMSIVNPILRKYDGKVAVVDKDEPGGICLTRGCIPSKMLLYPADVIAKINQANEFGVDATINKVDFNQVMKRMRSHINPEIESIKEGLLKSEYIDYYQKPASFVKPYLLKVGEQLISSNLIFLCTGSRPLIPPITDLEKIGYLTSREVLKLKEKPQSLLIIGGSYIGLEYAHFFSQMGTKVTIIEQLPRILSMEEPEISMLLEKKLKQNINIKTGYKVVKAKKTAAGKKELIATSKEGEKTSFTASEIMVAAGRRSNSDILHPEKGGIETDDNNWIKVNEHLETTQKNIWAMGDATGKHMLKHVANYESTIVYYNAVLNKNIKVDYHAVPYAVFTSPEVAGVGMREKEAIKKYGKGNLLIGFQKFIDTAKGSAMNAEDYFVKIITLKKNDKVVGAHIIGPHASILIQEIVNLMYIKGQTPQPIMAGMHIHPSLSEVVERAFFNRLAVDSYHQKLMEEDGDFFNFDYQK